MKLYPIAVWLALLVVVFASEYAVMVSLPWLLGEHSSRMLESVLDAVVLTLVLAPVLWWTIVRPLTEVNRLRAQFLADLFAQMESDRRRTAYELHDDVQLDVRGLSAGHDGYDPSLLTRLRGTEAR